MKKLVVLTGLIVVAIAATAASAQKIPAGQPFQQLETLVNSIAAQVAQLSGVVSGLAGQVLVLETKVTGIEATVAGIQATAITRTVFSGSRDLDGPGDVIRDAVGTDNIRRVRHFAAFPVAGLLADDPPTISLFQRRRTDGTPPFATTTGFIASNMQATPAQTLGGFSVFLDPTLIVVEDGQILVQFRFESYSPSTSPTPNIVRYGLDGPGGTGEYRLVVVR